MSWGITATVAGAVIQDSSARRAADAQERASSSAIAEQRQQYDQTREDYAPYRQAGVKALGQYQTEMNAPVSSAEVMSDPGYQFGLTQGQTALDRKTAAAGGRVSGAALKAAAQYGNDYATTKYDAAYARRSDRLNRLAALAGIGQSATSGTASAGSNASNNTSSLISAQGNATAASNMAQGNIWGNAINSVGAAWQKQAGSGSGVSSSYAPSGYASSGDYNRSLLRDSSGYGGSV